VSCGPKKKTSEKSPPASLDFREQKIYWLAFLAIAMILRLMQKRFSRPCEKKDGMLLVFQETELAVFFRYHHRRRFAVYISLYL